LEKIKENRSHRGPILWSGQAGEEGVQGRGGDREVMLASSSCKEKKSERGTGS